MWIGIVSLFPEMFRAITDYGVTSRAVNRQKLIVEIFNPREFTEDKHRTVDDRPYGGGPGMIMKVEPLLKAINAADQRAKTQGLKASVVYMSPQGRRLNQSVVNEFTSCDALIVVAGRYEGIDERLIQMAVDDELSLGDFVLTGGEIAAMALIDSLARFIPGVLGHDASAIEDSFFNGLLDCPHYTRPEDFHGMKVPEVLLQGNHEEIRRWRLKESLGRTWLRRPDLLEKVSLSKEQEKLLSEYKTEARIVDC